MANTTIKTDTSGLTVDRYSQYYSKRLLQHAIQLTRLQQFASQFDLPMHTGSTTLRMFRRSEADTDDVEPLSEGTISTDYTNSTLTQVDVTLGQYGEKVKISDVRQETDLINQLDLEVERMGENAALKVDDLLRDEIVSDGVYNGTTAITDSSMNIFCGHTTEVQDGKTEANLETVWDSWKCGDEDDLKIAVDHLQKAVAYLNDMRAPKFADGSYVAVLPPKMCYDLQNDSKWLNVNSYSNRERIYRGEIGEIMGVRVVMATNEWKQLSSAASFGTYSATGNVYMGVVLGRESLGSVKLAGSKSPLSPSFMVLRNPDKSDPYNQLTVAAWKGYFAAKVLNRDYLAVIHGKSTYDA